MTVQQLNKEDVNDFIELIRVFEQAFEMTELQIPGKAYLSRLLANPDFLVFVVKLEDKVIGGLTVYVLHGYYAEKPKAYIYDVGILPEYHRKGAGKMLIQHLISYCQDQGFEYAYVEAEADDDDAIHFYRSTQPQAVLQATHFTYNTSKP
jgi:aminoglycoside 3-N-acetyltransferase I